LKQVNVEELEQLDLKLQHSLQLRHTTSSSLSHTHTHALYSIQTYHHIHSHRQTDRVTHIVDI